MTREEVEAVIDVLGARERSAERIDVTGERALGFRESARMLREAHAKSEAEPTTEPGTRTLMLPAKESFEMTYSGVAMSTGIEIPAFGPGLWIIETVERSAHNPKVAHVTAYPVTP